MSRKTQEKIQDFVERLGTEVIQTEEDQDTLLGTAGVKLKGVQMTLLPETCHTAKVGLGGSGEGAKTLRKPHP